MAHFISQNVPRCLKSIGKETWMNPNGFSSMAECYYSTKTATFETKPFHLHKLDDGPLTTVTLTKPDAIDYYTKLYTIRCMENSVETLFKEQVIRGACHLYSGQEAVAVGIKAALRPNDAVITAYRAHGWTYVMGVDPFSVLSEAAGRQSGCARGKGGSMHMYCENFYGGNGIVGTQVPVGVGLAFALKYRGIDGLSVSLYGDGAANQGQIFEAYNMAKLFNLPAIFVCENNNYGKYTSKERSSANTAYYTRGDYIPGIWVDGMDVLTVREAARYAVNHCIGGKGPILLETDTYRYSGHTLCEEGRNYRTSGDIEEVKRTRDPITCFKRKIVTADLVTADELKEIEDEAHARIDDAAAKAKGDKEIGLEELTADIYSLNLGGKIRNVTSVNALEHKRIGPAINS